LRQAFHDGRFANAGFANQDRIVLCAPRQNLHHAPNLLVAPDYGIELGAAREFSEVARVFFQGFVGGFRVLRSDPLRATNARQSLQNGFVGRALTLEQLASWITILSCEGQKNVFGRNVFVFEFCRFIEGALQDVIQRPAHMVLAKAGNFGQAPDFSRDFLRESFTANSESRQERRHNAVRLLDQSGKQMNQLNLLVSVLSRHFLRGLHSFLRFHRHLFKSQHVPPQFQ